MSNRADFHEESGVSEDLFSDSLESIFGHHQVCSFDGSICNPDARSPVKVNLEPNLPSKQSPWKTLDMRIPDQPTNGLFSQMQWDSGLYLCDMICDGRGPFHNLSNKRVLEFGAGTGLPSLLSALKGSPHVVCSDYDDHYLIDNLRRNVTANSVRNVDVVGHIWGQDVAPLIPDGRKFNLILCADTLWMSDQLENLLKSLTATIDKQDESSRVVIIAGFHTNRPRKRCFEW
ncbi:Putative nicotinamide N-methyltransferase [Wallemia ichthyophaga EXF-994]|uniref:Putative nicotinamide N-methyltransferase n=1 Tax=Wallemia ichthyophaga (strain EXF-994 / CBS 113033) TaxID=1299270 RepID=R9ACH3_WALI9|nr:Putative nicotinamide N-methyltransferase [Wallemia ichthyophaga EXF-994]EOQ99913.1 Putative nicotinamide N-methyltransferase [Wallemia ichthyophaga EXF-994]